jgi:integrase
MSSLPLRRGELIGLQRHDVNFEILVIHVRRSVVMMVQGLPKTEASAKDLSLDTALAESLTEVEDIQFVQQAIGLCLHPPGTNANHAV